MNKKRNAFVYGTRPEFLKIYTVIIEAKKRKLNFITINTGQHSKMLDDLEKIFNFKPDYNLKVQKPNITNSELLSDIIHNLNLIITKEKIESIIAQGDTLTVYGASIVSFLEKIPFHHIEAGLRTSNIIEPFPEEYNRRATSLIANTHFAPTIKAKDNLVNERIDSKKIYVVGNTIIDMLNYIMKKEKIEIVYDNYIVITSHRRENIGENLNNICQSIIELSNENPNYIFKWILHPNPNVRLQLKKIFENAPENFIFIEPLNYIENIKLLAHSKLIITDSGGIQEEAPSLNKKVLILRNETERPEVIDCGCGVLVGSDIVKIKEEFYKEIRKNNNQQYNNPFGNGNSSIRILDIIDK
jgi:UDP-N-acetylglucosamine 2-epimerase (non-hydrolysing)